MFEDKVFIVKLPAIDGLPTGAIVVGEVSSLAHKLRDDSMKAASLKAKALLVCAQAAEILCIILKEKKKSLLLLLLFVTLVKLQYLSLIKM